MVNKEKGKNGLDKIIIFRIEKNLYGLEITDVQGIEPLPEITNLGLPHVPDYIAGMFNLRGEVVPLIDARKKLNIKVKDNEDKTLKRVLLFEIEKGKVGIIVDEVREIYEFAEEDIHPIVQGIGGLELGFVKGIGKVDNKLITILDIEVFITSEGKLELDFIDDLEDYLETESGT
ncbi:MAG: purine-binding chemotaxis protein CheW [Halanaerobiales bacterium]|nr:purine-binding chemotaxis protein CheW [Halanaerobiales bacterium]